MPGPKRIFTPEQELEIVRRHAAGEAVLAIARDFPGVHVQTLHNTLKRHGGSTKSPLDEEKRARVIEACLNGSTVIDAARLFDVSESTVSRILRAHRKDGGVVMMPQGAPPTCDLDHGAFDVLTPASLYWMGFIFNDGTIGQDNQGAPRLGVELAETDRGHLEKLRTFLGSTHTIGSRPGGDECFSDGMFASYKIRSERIVAALQSRGMAWKKPERCPTTELASAVDFWRGAVDADGGLGVSGAEAATIFLTGHELALEQFQLFLARKLDLHFNQSRTKSGIFSVSTSGSPALSIARLLYENAPIALDRKNSRAQAMLAGDMRASAAYE